jgi:hypothetical protein
MTTHWRNVLLTVVVVLPLAAAFIKVTNFFPVPVWSLFSDRRELAKGHTYYVLKGRTADGTWREIPPVRIMAALNGRHFMFASYTAANQPFLVESPHPENVRLMDRAGGVNRLPRGARMDDLLRALGTVYNQRLPPESQDRLTLIRMEERRWPGGHFGDYDRVVHLWETEL